jgi:outer membrane protein assembly factor BamB
MRQMLALIILTCLPDVSAAAEPADAKPVKHRIMFFEYGSGGNRLVELDPDGKVVWEHKPQSLAVIFQPLDNGNVVYAYGGKPTGVVEINREQKQVWNYVSKCPQVLGVHRLSNGNTLIAEQGPAAAVEVDAKGTVVKSTPLTTSHEHFHQQVRNIIKLADGHILAAHEGEAAVREVDADGKVVWEYKNVTNVVGMQRLSNGNTLIGGGTQKRIIEVTPKGDIAWEFGEKDAPDLNLTWISSVQVLKNGNIIAGNFLRGAEGKGAHAFEVTREKKVVWTFADHKFRSITTIRVLDDQ